MNTPEVDAAIRQVLRGKRDAFRLLVKSYELTVRSYISSQVYHMDEVDDLAQEVFIAAFRSLKTFRRGEDFGAWLRGIARNKLYNHFRGYSRRVSALDRFRRQVVEILEPDLEKAAASERTEAVEALLRCVSKLPERLRHVVRSGLEGARPAALAEEMSTTVGAIYNLHYRANKLLRECMQAETANG
jgi:RNA polymerase sigma-70 factor (ECF subfamily)